MSLLSIYKCFVLFAVVNGPQILDHGEALGALISPLFTLASHFFEGMNLPLLCCHIWFDSLNEVHWLAIKKSGKRVFEECIKETDFLIVFPQTTRISGSKIFCK